MPELDEIVVEPQKDWTGKITYVAKITGYSWATFYGLTPEQARERATKALVSLMEAEARRKAAVDGRGA